MTANNELLPTLFIAEDTRHVLLVDFEICLDMVLSRGVIFFIAIHENEFVPEDWPDETYYAEVRRRIRAIRIPRKLALGYAATKGLLNDTHQAFRKQYARAYHDYVARAEADY
ncbi:MAG: hypothetical protein RL398_1628, partial [Planctomycetota bacterium]